uniref:T-complex protein 10A homolog 2-like isoform X2 n=1 Tax=Callithrix jacchus TaxID=9483 RepID=UPI0023DD22C0|nr:T-complex protein 10A homolog 2-like isoform X2 [Callithrix jacchus]
MLEGQLEAGEPKEDTHPEDPWPGAAPDTEKTAVAAEVPREDSNAGEMPPLQQQITRLDQELGRQESLWADVHRKLQSHIDALRKQNLELREELRALVRPQWKAEKPAASPHAGRGSHTLALEPAFEISPLSADEEKKLKYTGRKSQSTTTLLAQRSSSNNLAPPKAMHPSSRSPQNSSGRKSPVQASQAATLQEQMAAVGGDDGSSSVSESSEGGFLSHVQPDELAGSSANTAQLQVGRAPSKACAVTTFPDPSQKEPSAGKKTTIIRFPNGDVKKITPDRRVIYFNANAQTTRTTYPDGLEVVQFPNKQTEKFYPDGSREIVFPDGTVERFQDGWEETLFPDGTIVRVERSSCQHSLQPAGMETKPSCSAMGRKKSTRPSSRGGSTRMAPSRLCIAAAIRKPSTRPGGLRSRMQLERWSSTGSRSALSTQHHTGNADHSFFLKQTKLIPVSCPRRPNDLGEQAGL